MSVELGTLLWPFGIFIIMLFIIGFYYVLMTYNLVRALIGLEILIKAVTLLLVVVGYAGHRLAFIQSLIITLIVIEVVLIAVAVGILLGVHGKNNSLDVRELRKLKG
jgi:multisubunit Na+/H+ antiporter MnhC subunit